MSERREATGDAGDAGQAAAWGFVEMLLERNRTVRIATVTPSGAPIIAPVWFAYLEGRFVITMPESATVRNVERTGQATVLVDEGTGFSGLRGAIIETEGSSFRVDEAPPRVEAIRERERQRYREELAELAAVRAAIADASEGVAAATYRLELIARRARWFTLGGGITDVVELPAPGRAGERPDG